MILNLALPFNPLIICSISIYTNRLFESAKLIGMKIPYDAKELNDAQSQVVKINNSLM